MKKFSKKIVFTITFFLVISFFINSVYAVKESKKTVYDDYEILKSDIVVPDDFSSIQKAINNADPGSSIYVRHGCYKENIVINKKGIKIFGEDNSNTIIDGGKCLKNTITVNAEKVRIENFSIINGIGNEALWDVSGVFINTSEVTVKNNIIMYNTLGLCSLDIAYNLTICHNQFLGDSYFFANYEKTHNKFTLKSCLHNVHNNTVNGKPSYYFKDKNNFVVPNNAGHIILVNCTNVTVNDTYFTQADFPVLLYYCNNCVVENLTIEDSYGELITLHCENITLQNNKVKNMIFGICLDYKSKNCIVRYNDLSNSYSGVTVMTSSYNNEVYDNYLHDNDMGVWLISARQNKIYENDIYDNKIGIRIIWGSTNNRIENNTLMGNPYQAQILNVSKNYWNHNYWNRPRILPKLIFGFKSRGLRPGMLCCINIDKNPAMKPI